MQRLHLQVGVVCLQGCVVLLQGDSLPLQSQHLSLLALRVTLQLLQLSLHRLALRLQSGVLQERRRGEEKKAMILSAKEKNERLESSMTLKSLDMLRT